VSGQLVGGYVAPGFEGVREAFIENFASLDEVGAAFAAVHRGTPVVDLWGGVASRETRTPWERDTMQVIFSGTKGLVATCLLILVDRGLLDPSERVSSYWPEFGARGKGGITVNELVSHRARLPGIQRTVTEDEILDGARMADLLARQPQDPDPRAGNTYHALTYGWLCGELLRRIDGRTARRFFAEEIASPLGLDIWIGIPPELEPRVSALHYGLPWEPFSPEDIANDALLRRVWANPPLFPPNYIPWNTLAYHTAEIPGAGAIGTARSIARFYACLAEGGRLDDVRLVSQSTLGLARRCLARRRDAIADQDEAYGFGYELQTPELMLGPPSSAFGHGGAGGSAHGAWPEQRVGFSYCMNEMRYYPGRDLRADSLFEALHSALPDAPGDAEPPL
jgi:CubicO group peptidase (beta-lactamase class C family)